MNDLLKFMTCGSVDDGKSTLIGHMLYDAKLLFTDQERALELESRIGSRDGLLDYSLLLDGLMAEREQGITIDVAYRYFTTERRSFIVADAPGHEEYTRNMAVAASFADAAVILLGSTVLRMVACSEPFYGVSIVIEGMLQGAGRTIVPFVFNIIGMWGVRIAGTFVCTKLLGMGLVSAWGCMIGHNMLLFVLFVRYFRSGRWNPLEKRR